MGRTIWRKTLTVALLVGTIGAEVLADEGGLRGSRVRVRTIEPGQPWVGVLEESTTDELILRTNGPSSPVRIRRTDVAGLEVSRGTRRHVLKGLLAGAASSSASPWDSEPWGRAYRRGARRVACSPLKRW